MRQGATGGRLAGRAKVQSMPTGTPQEINFSWLVKLRWGAIAGQLVTILGVQFGMKIRLPLAVLLGLVLFESITNVACMFWLRARRPVGDGVVAGVLALDVLLLTGLLFFTGGPFNPFSFLYLVHIALAAVVLRSTWTWVLVALSLASSGALHFANALLDMDYQSPDRHEMHMQMHMEGMWIASAVAAIFIVTFVTRVRRALEAREQEVGTQRALAARNEKLAALGTLAAGAAHELATPLGTIAVVVREMERQGAMGRPPNDDDVGLIRSQVARCREILDQLAADAGQGAGEAFALVSVGTLLTEATTNLMASRLVIDFSSCENVPMVCVPLRSVARAIRGLVKNALEASPAETRVTIAVRSSSGFVEIEISDKGVGLPPDVVSRIGEPFFTTKSPGGGMGLGVFLARSVLDRLGGTLVISSVPGTGTRVIGSLPLGSEK